MHGCVLVQVLDDNNAGLRGPKHRRLKNLDLRFEIFRVVKRIDPLSRCFPEINRMPGNLPVRNHHFARALAGVAFHLRGQRADDFLVNDDRVFEDDFARRGLPCRETQQNGNAASGSQQLKRRDALRTGREVDVVAVLAGCQPCLTRKLDPVLIKELDPHYARFGLRFPNTADHADLDCQLGIARGLNHDPAGTFGKGKSSPSRTRWVD